MYLIASSKVKIMNNSEFQQKLVIYIEEKLKIKVVNLETPPQGMTSKVFFMKNSNNEEYAVKYGDEAMNDVPAFELISKKKIDIPVPRLIGFFEFEGSGVLVLERIKYPLLESVNIVNMAKYIPSMVGSLKTLHTVQSDNPGLLTSTSNVKTWKDMRLSIFNGQGFDWDEVANREGLDHDLILNSVEKIVSKIQNTQFLESGYSLLHTDFNQRNLFIDPHINQITGIIDWEDAMYGDPIFDFARVRMLIWHFDLGSETVEKYYKLMNYTSEQKNLEDLYWLSRVIQYLGWYSEELNDFNVGRIKLHQEFLRSYDWQYL